MSGFTKTELGEVIRCLDLASSIDLDMEYTKRNDQNYVSWLRERRAETERIKAKAEKLWDKLKSEEKLEVEEE